MSHDPDIIEAQWKPVDLRAGRVPAQPRRAAPRVRSDDASTSGFADRWPTLAVAMQRYRQNVAEEFIGEVRGSISAGIIRFDDRKRLAARAAELEIHPFDAQLLIACAVRQWYIDQGQSAPAGSGKAPRAAVRSKWRHIAILVALSVILDAILIWQMSH